MGLDAGHAAARHRRRHRLPRLVHQRPDRGPARRRRRAARAARSPTACGCSSCPGSVRVAAAGRGGGPRRGLHRGRRRVAGRRLLDVPRHEPRPARAGRAQRVDVQPQLRGPAGQGRAHPPGLAAGRRRDRRHRPPGQPGRPRPADARRADRWSRSPPTPARAVAAAPQRTSTPTRSSRPSTSSGSPAPASRTGCSPPGASDPDFVLNRPEYAGATVLVAGPDFGTGSSREHAVWALQDYGFRVVVSLAVRRHLPRQRRQGRAAHGAASSSRRRARCGPPSRPTRPPR